MSSPAPEISQQAEWVRRPERSNGAMLRLMTWISLRLGRAPARLVLAGISLYFLLFAPDAKAASRAYLRRALDREPGFADLFRHFHSFASTIHDRVFLLNARFDLFQLEVHGEDIIQEVLAAGRGAYVHVARGVVNVAGQQLSAGDALSIEGEEVVRLIGEPTGRAKNASANVASDCSVAVVGLPGGKNSCGNTRTAAVP